MARGREQEMRRIMVTEMEENKGTGDSGIHRYLISSYLVQLGQGS